MSEHIQHLRAVLEVLKQNQLFAKLSKCIFAQSFIEYLGHVINGQGVCTDPDKISIIQKWPSPANVTQLRAFLGLTGYYRRFIKGYGILCRPLFNAVKKDSFIWNADQEQAFLHLKKVMSHPPVLALPNFSQPFILEGDASGTGIGAVLMQRGQPIAFFSKSLGPKAMASSIYEKEAMAILEAIKKWKHYFASTSLIIRTYQQSLKYIQEQRLVEGIQHKLLIKLLGLNYTVEYKEGRTNKVADALSRATHSHRVLAISTIIPKWIEQVLLSYNGDTQCSDMINKLSVDAQAIPHFTLTNGLLRYKQRLYIGGNGDLKQQLINSFHASALGGHSEERATYQRIKLNFFWPKMKQQIIDFVKTCAICQKNKSENVPYPGLLQPLPVPDMAWTHISTAPRRRPSSSSSPPRACVVVAPRRRPFLCLISAPVLVSSGSGCTDGEPCPCSRCHCRPAPPLTLLLVSSAPEPKAPGEGEAQQEHRC
jgi:hypothetical protein